jgi:hypothetical protein
LTRKVFLYYISSIAIDPHLKMLSRKVYKNFEGVGAQKTDKSKQQNASMQEGLNPSFWQ